MGYCGSSFALSAAYTPPVLYAGSRLAAGESIASGSRRLTMKTTGNLVLTDSSRAIGDQIVWSSGTTGTNFYTVLENGRSCGTGISGRLRIKRDDGNPNTCDEVIWDSGYPGTGDDFILQFPREVAGIQIVSQATNQIVWTAGGFVLYANSFDGPSAYAFANKTFTMHSDGNLVYADPSMYGGSWSSKTGGRSCSLCKAIFNVNGNLVIYSDVGEAIWSSGTRGGSGYQFQFFGYDVNTVLRIVNKANRVTWYAGPLALSTLASNPTQFPIKPGPTSYLMPNRALELRMQGNGNLVLFTVASYDVATGQSVLGPYVWATSQRTDKSRYGRPTTGMSCTGGCHMKFTADGNLVLFEGAAWYWSSGSAGYFADHRLVLSPTSPPVRIINSLGAVIFQ
jgi:hypothetical protein